MPRRIFYDTEFIDDGKTIELISIGMIDEDDNKLYLVNCSLNVEGILRRKWLRENVLPYLPVGDTDWLSRLTHPELMPKTQIANEVKSFILGPEYILNRNEEFKSELWAYFGAYDHVALAQLWGPMSNLPSGIPMYTHDIKQEMDRLGVSRERLEREGITNDNSHCALDDAIWNRKVWGYLTASVNKPKNHPVMGM